MTDQTRAITNYQKTQTLLKSEEVQKQFERILGQKKAAGLIASVMNTVYNNDELRDSNPASILGAAMRAAIFDLPVDENLSYAGIVPFKINKKVGGNWETRKVATFQVMKKGYIQLALRTKQYDTINAGPIFEGQLVVQDQMTGRIRLNGQRISDKAIGYFGYFRLKDGYEYYDYMTVEELEAWGKKYSKSYENDKSRWRIDKPVMYEKTLIKRILRHGPLSLELGEELARDDETADGLYNEFDGVPPAETIDAIWTETELSATDVPDEHGAPSPESPLQPEQTEEKYAEGDIYLALVDAKLSPNIHEAREALKYCKTGWETPEKACAWKKVYNAWRDMGGDVKQAAESANNGEVPK